MAVAERIIRTEADRARSEALHARAAADEQHRRERARRAKAVTEARAAVAGAPGVVPTDVRLAARALNVLDELRSIMVTAEANGFCGIDEHARLRDVDVVYVADEAHR